MFTKFWVFLIVSILILGFLIIKYKFLAKIAIEILDAYKIKKAHIVGHSMGGLIVQLMAMDYSDRVFSITSVSAGTFAKSSEPMTDEEKKNFDKTWQVLLSNKPTKNYQQSVDGFLKVYKYLHGDMQVDENIAKDYIKDLYYRSKHVNWFKKFSKENAVHNHVKAQANISDRILDLQNIDIPTLIIHGQKDNIVLPRLNAQLAAKLIPNSKLKIIPEMGHMILNKKLFIQLSDIILNFIKRVENVEQCNSN